MIHVDELIEASTGKDGRQWPEKRRLTLLDLDGGDSVRHLLQMEIPVDDAIAGPGANISGMTGDFVIHTISQYNQAAEVRLVGKVVKLTGQMQEKPVAASSKA